MSTSPDLNAATDRLVDSLSNARDIAVAAVRDDIAPAVAAAVEAARDASSPVYAEAASRAGDALDAAKTHVGKSRGGKSRSRRRRSVIVATVIGAGAAAATIAKRRSSRAGLIDVTDTKPAAAPIHESEESTADSGPESA